MRCVFISAVTRESSGTAGGAVTNVMTTSTITEKEFRTDFKRMQTKQQKKVKNNKDDEFSQTVLAWALPVSNNQSQALTTCRYRELIID